jgi:hypothetical protein
MTAPATTRATSLGGSVTTEDDFEYNFSNFSALSSSKNVDVDSNMPISLDFTTRSSDDVIDDDVLGMVTLNATFAKLQKHTGCTVQCITLACHTRAALRLR